MAAAPIDTSVADGGLKQLLESKRMTALTITWLMGSDAGQLGIDKLTDFGAWFSVAKYEDEIKALIDGTADTVEG